VKSDAAYVYISLLEDIKCVDGCLDCPYFFRFDICVPEYTTAILDFCIDSVK